MNMRMKFVTALLATSIVACNNKKDDQPEPQKSVVLNNKKFVMLQPDEVGVTEHGSVITNHLSNHRTKIESDDNNRYSVYFTDKKDSAVITTYGNGWYYNSGRGGDPRKFKDMLEFEKKEFAETQQITDSLTYYKNEVQRLKNIDSLKNE